MNTSHRLALALLEDDHSMISYRPRWRKLTKGLATTILLQQIYYRWSHNRKQPFYKFKEPCDHGLYRPGDSWTEELGMSRSEFDTAIKRIGYKRSKTRQGPHEFPVEYWTDASRVTFYTIHLGNFCQWLEQIYSDIAIKQDSNFTKSQKEALPLNQDFNVTKSNNSTLSYTEKTTKNTIQNKKNTFQQFAHTVLWPYARAWMETLHGSDFTRYQTILQQVHQVEPALTKLELNAVQTEVGRAVIVRAWQVAQKEE